MHPGAVLMIPVLPDGRLIVERQFRYPLDRVFLEFSDIEIDLANNRATTRTGRAALLRTCASSRIVVVALLAAA